MATQTVTVSKLSSLVLHLSIPVTETRLQSERNSDQQRRSDDEAGADAGEDKGRATDWSTRGNVTGSDSSDASQLHPQLNAGRHNDRMGRRRGGKHKSDGETQLQLAEFEGDKISQAYFSRMVPVPGSARHRLLIAVEPRRMAPRRRWVQASDASVKRDLPAPVLSDFCIPFSRQLLRKMRANRWMLQSISNRTCCLMYIRKTLLLRGTRRTKTWAKYLMCRFFCYKLALLNRCFRLMERFDRSFSVRYPCEHNRARVTLVPNRSVPENTVLRMSRQRIRHLDDYFGKMPLLPDPHLANQAAKLTAACVNENSLLAQLVAPELRPS